MSNVGSRVKKLITEPKITLRKIHHKFKYDRKGAWDLIAYELKNDRKQLMSNIKRKLPLKYKAEHDFTIISACYNVGQYLDEYFVSIINQSLNFKKHIQVICVDDGSSDNTAEVIKKWQKKYPANIHYLYKENGGQASARNLGLELVKTEWVTFVDPDDFLDKDYFFFIDQEINEQTDMLVGNLIFWVEKTKSYQDSHPLQYRFHGDNNRFLMSDLQKNINLSAASTFFRMSLIRTANLSFDEKVKPNFEDGKFIAEYLLAGFDSEVVFVKDSKYLYRKREANDSTLDMAWTKLQKYYDVWVYGYLPILKRYIDEKGFVPVHIQRGILYDAAWYIKQLLDQEEKIAFLSHDQKETFFSLFKEVFQYIDSSTILNFELAGLWFKLKVGAIGLLKNQSIASNIVYIENIDREKKQILVSFFTFFDELEQFNLDEEEVYPVYSKEVVSSFCGRKFVVQKRYWLPFNKSEGILKIYLNHKQTRISLFGKHYKEIRMATVLQAFKPSTKYNTDGSWLLMDRDIQADDNAEHLYRFIKNTYPTEKIYFALNKSSHDWNRLEAEGFNLLDYGSKEFEKQLCKVSKIVSSHLDRYINNYFGDEYEYSKKYVFLQHGVTLHNMSKWFNSKKNLQCFITTTQGETNSIIKGKEYHLSEKEVVLAGFPRHDKLLQGNQSASKIIVVMPTWRESVVGHVVANGNQRELNKEFMTTSYAQNWYAFLHSQKLKELANTYGYKVVFAPHANIEPYLKDFNVPTYISMWSARSSDTSIQELFQTSKIMITDYSSVAFEMAYLNKLVLYFQFDAKEVFSSKAHISKKGYFSYEEDGFGPVSYSLDDLLINLEESLKQGGEALEPYKERIEKTFPFRDGMNCERVYQAIKSLDAPETRKVDVNLLEKYMMNAYQEEGWDLLLKRSQQLQIYGDSTQRKRAIKLENYALLEKYRFDELDYSSDIFSQEELLVLKAKQEFLSFRWDNAVDYLYQLHEPTNFTKILLLRCYAELGKTDKVKDLIKEFSNLSDSEKIVCKMLLALSERDWYQIITLLNKEKDKFLLEDLKKYKVEIMLSRAYRMLDLYEKAHSSLVCYEEHSRNIPESDLEVIRLAFVKKNYQKVVSKLEDSFVEESIPYLPEDVLSNYLFALEAIGDVDKVALLLEKIINKRIDMFPHIIPMLIKRKSWDMIVGMVEPLMKTDLSNQLIYPLILAKFHKGLLDEAYELIKQPSSEHPYEYWNLVFELALLKDNLVLAKYCVHNMLLLYPEVTRETNLQRLIMLAQ